MKMSDSPFALLNDLIRPGTTFRKVPALAGALMLCAVASNAADLVWIGGTGNWNAAANWSPAQIPTASDNTWITNVGTYTVTVPQGSTANAGSLTVGGTSGTQTLSIDRATVTLGGASVINSSGVLDFLVAQSVLTGAGNLTVNGTMNWANGTMSGAGTTTIGNGAVLAIGAGGVTLGRALNNGGAATWAGGNLTMSAGAAFNNLAGGIFDITTDGRLMGSATTPINNGGLIRQLGGVSTIVTAPLNNSSTLQVLAGTLSLNLGGTHSGTFSNAPGAILNFGGGSHGLGASAVVAGAGVLSVSGTATTLGASGTFNAGSTLSVESGIATLNSGCNVTAATLNVNAGVLVFNSSGTVSSANFAGGTIGGTSPITVTGLLDLNGGTITNALVTANGGITIRGNTTLNGGKLINPATAVWSAGVLSGANGAVFSNLTSAVFINTFDGNIATGAGTTPVFVNAGVFEKTNGTAAAGTTSIDFQFLNTGTVEVRTNTLRYGFNQQTAGLTLLDGGNISAQAQPIQLLGGSIVGTGSVSVANAQNVINSSSMSPGLPFGEMDISGNYQQTASGELNIDLAGYSPGSGFDLVTVSAGGAGGVATLGGKLNVTLAGAFSPTNGATFKFLTAISRVGAFATFNYPSNDIGMQLLMDATSASVKVTNLKPLVANPIADPAPVTYGAPFNFQFAANTFSDPDNDALTYTATGLPTGIVLNAATRTFSGTAGQAGVFSVNLVATDNGAPPLSTTNSFNITVNPATLTIAADPKSKVYGAAEPALTYSVTGLLLADTAASVLTGSLTRAAGEGVAGSPYVITQGTLAASANYAINFTGSALTISPAALTITADPKTKPYGTTDPSLTFGVSGLQFSDTQAAVLTGALTRAAGETVGGSPYAITRGTLTANANYTISFVPGALTITKVALTVTADAKAKIYGTSDPAFTVTYSGFVNGDTSAVLGGTLGFVRAPGQNVGSYLITPSGLTSGNYTISFNTGTLTIIKAALSVSADAKTKTYGLTDPTFTVTYSGLTNGDTAAALGGTLNLSRAPGENVGSYLITPSGLASGNYTITFNTAALTITKAALSVTADAKTKIYGSADPAFTVTYAGFANGDTAAALGGVLSLNRAAGENVGSYAITPGGLTSGNYTITFNTGSFTITKAPLSITADSKTKTFGSADPLFTVTYAGFVNGDTSASLGGALALNRVPGESVGSYLITPSGLTSGNYTITFNTGTLTITATAPTIQSLTRPDASHVLVTWGALSNANYRVQFKADLNATGWTDLAGDVAATGSTASKTDILTSSNRFYRILVLP